MLAKYGLDFEAYWQWQEQVDDESHSEPERVCRGPLEEKCVLHHVFQRRLTPALSGAEGRRPEGTPSEARGVRWRALILIQPSPCTY